MSKLGLVLRELHRSETSLGRDLLAVADRHKVDHEIFHVARDLAGWSQDHVRRISDARRAMGVRLDPQPRWQLGPLSVAVQRGSELLGRRPEPGLLLLADLRRLHRKAAASPSTGSCSRGRPRPCDDGSCSASRRPAIRRRCGPCGGPTPISRSSHHRSSPADPYRLTGRGVRISCPPARRSCTPPSRCRQPGR